MMESGRGIKGPSDGRTMGPTGTWVQVKDSKEGKLDGGRHAQARARNSFGPPGMGGKRRRAVAVDRRGHCPGGRLLRDRVIRFG